MGASCPPASTLCVQLSKISIWCYKIKLVKYNNLKTNKFTFINLVSKILTKTLCIQRNVRGEPKSNSAYQKVCQWLPNSHLH